MLEVFLQVNISFRG
ncbi:hypothetical protein QN277_025183 [Acacia crassicarpa]|uniref:Uncharacterized protein n=1 Tax=Acacia crassicarpa TaxID=499986 RepID=A0AAE1JDS5_9FABA|nr:hypothetical protein QN277_025183 [Acacia crassicarpa]